MCIRDSHNKIIFWIVNLLWIHYYVPRLLGGEQFLKRGYSETRLFLFSRFSSISIGRGGGGVRLACMVFVLREAACDVIWREPSQDFWLGFLVLFPARPQMREKGSGNVPLFHPKKKLMRPPPHQIDLLVPKLNRLVHHSGKKGRRFPKSSEDFLSWPKVELKSSEDFAMLAQRIRKVSKVHHPIRQSLIRLWKRRKRLHNFLQHMVLWFKDCLT